MTKLLACGANNAQMIGGLSLTISVVEAIEEAGLSLSKYTNILVWLSYIDALNRFPKINCTAAIMNTTNWVEDS